MTMFRILTFLLVFGSLNLSYAQKHKAYYSSGQLQEIGKFKNQKEVGKWIFYYENGQISSTGKFKDGNKILVPRGEIK